MNLLDRNWSFRDFAAIEEQNAINRKEVYFLARMHSITVGMIRGNDLCTSQLSFVTTGPYPPIREAWGQWGETQSARILPLCCPRNAGWMQRFCFCTKIAGITAVQGKIQQCWAKYSAEVLPRQCLSPQCGGSSTDSLKERSKSPLMPVGRGSWS